MQKFQELMKILNTKEAGDSVNYTGQKLINDNPVQKKRIFFVLIIRNSMMIMLENEYKCLIYIFLIISKHYLKVVLLIVKII